MKKILVIKSHPKENSFCDSLAEKYIDGAKKSKNIIKVLNLRDLNLEKFLDHGHNELPKLTSNLLDAQKLIVWADHLVFVYPLWWATTPAILKLFFEIVFIPGFAYKHKKSSRKIPQWDKLLKNKSARIIVTMDSPPFYYKLFVGDPGFKTMKHIMNYCGIKPLKKIYFGSIKKSSKDKRERWLEKAYSLGLNE